MWLLLYVGTKVIHVNKMAPGDVAQGTKALTALNIPKLPVWELERLNWHALFLSTQSNLSDSQEILVKFRIRGSLSSICISSRTSTSDEEIMFSSYHLYPQCYYKDTVLFRFVHNWFVQIDMWSYPAVGTCWTNSSRALNNAVWKLSDSLSSRITWHGNLSGLSHLP